MDLDRTVSSDDGDRTEDNAVDADGEGTLDRDDSEKERLWDVGYDDSNVYEYECLDCGVIVVAESHPAGCPTCDAAMRNRAMPIE